MTVHSPGYWMAETSGVLRPAVEAFLRNEPMSDAQVAAMRAYLRQWIVAEWFGGAELDELRGTVDGLVTKKAISAWLDRALSIGVDPL